MVEQQCCLGRSTIQMFDAPKKNYLWTFQGNYSQLISKVTACVTNSVFANRAGHLRVAASELSLKTRRGAHESRPHANKTK